MVLRTGKTDRDLRAGRRYLFDTVLVYFALLILLIVVGFIILALPYETTYIGDSGADNAYFTTFLVMIVGATAIMIIGLFRNAMIWMEGRLSGHDIHLSRSSKLVISAYRLLRAVFSGDFARHVGVFVRDTLLLRRLRRLSGFRWLVHSMIFFGFLGILILDIITVIAMDLLHVEAFIEQDGWGKLWIRDFGFELFGLMLLIGLVAAAARRFVVRPRQLVTGSEDVVSILLLLLVVLSGFIVEGVAISSGLPGHESNAEFSFVGAIFSAFLPSVSADAYAQIWFAHSLISVALIAYIPFSKLFHAFAAPLAIQLDAIIGKGGGSGIWQMKEERE